jgi:glutathione synthase/RimK-type ligase-like ATP-grasp enzyme
MAYILNKNFKAVFMNQFSILAKNQETYFIKRFSAELGEVGLNIINPWHKPCFKPSSGIILVRTTGVYGDDQDLEYLISLNPSARIINPLKAVQVFRQKSSQYVSFQKNSFPHLPWIHLRNGKLEKIHSFLDQLKIRKLLIKPNRGQGGWGIRVFSTSEFNNWWRDSLDYDYVLQPYLGLSEEFRLFFIGHKKYWVLKREASQNSLAANFTQGGEALLVSPPSWASPLLRKVTSLYKLDYGAIDILIMKEKIFVLEVNIAPGIEQLENITGLNIARILLKSLCQKYLSNS